MNENAVHDIRRILNVVLALEAAFKAQTKQQAKPHSTAPRPQSKPPTIKLIKRIEPIGPRPTSPKVR
jgi:hypothetical protein